MCFYLLLLFIKCQIIYLLLSFQFEKFKFIKIIYLKHFKRGKFLGVLPNEQKLKLDEIIYFKLFIFFATIFVNENNFSIKAAYE